MCGIAGVYHSDNHCPDLSVLTDMLSMLRHRGPDSSGFYRQPGIGLAHARLSIIDLSTGQQPMANEDSSVWITFNGEIFNYLELRQELIRRGHCFSTRSDTEVILHLYEEYGEQCVTRLNGQWAFGIWDARRRKLFLSRDRLGVRPLFYTQQGDTLAFASEIKALLRFPGVERILDVRALDQLFTFWCTVPPRTLFVGIHELPPAHSLIFEDGKLEVRRYWDLTPQAHAQPDSETCFVEELHALLTDAVRIRLRSDVPVGSYLSGGLDSTIVTALAQRFVSSQLRTFSIEFDSQELDESAYQKIAVDFLKTKHSRMPCCHREVAEAFPLVIWHTEKPVIRAAPVPMHLLSNAVRSAGYKVVLTGEGADEFFGGYDIYKETKVRRFWLREPASERRSRLLQRLYPYQSRLHQSGTYQKSFFRVSTASLNDPFFSHLPRWTLTSRVKLFFSDDLKSTLQNYDCLADLSRSLPPAYFSWDSFMQAQYLEGALLLPGYILSSQGDRVAMSHSVETRHPFLDYRVVEFGARTPLSLKMKVLNEKYILKKAFQPWLPPEVTARKKQPYRAPDGSSFFVPGAPDYLADLLSPDSLVRSGIFHAPAVGQLVDKFRKGAAIGVKDDMALVGILSTQLIMHSFIQHFSPGGPSCEASNTSCAAS